MIELVRILHIDDAAADRELVRDALEKEHGGFVVIQAASRKELEARLAEGEYDVVLSDFNILGFDGLDVIDLVRQKSPHVPVIIVTGTGSETIAVEAMKRSAADYVIKTPSHIRRLPLTVQAVLEKARLQAERKRAEEELARTAREWQTTFDATHDAMWIISQDDSILRCNKTAERLFQRRRGEIVGKYCWEIVHGTTGPIPECPLLRAKHSLRRETMEMQIGARWFQVIVDPILNTAGGYAGAVHIVNDITERVRAQEALRGSEEKYRTLVETMSDGLNVCDEEGRFTYVNRRFCEMLGYEEDELIGRHFFEFQDEKNRKFIAEQLERRRAGIEEVYEIEWTRKEGTEVTARVSPKAVFAEDGAYKGSFAVVADITERRRAEEEREKLQAQLLQAQKMDSVGRLAGGVAHDFNNMLSVILGHTELALFKMDPKEPLHAGLQEIHKAARHSADITRQLLAFARKQAIDPKVLDLNETVEGMLKMLRRLIREDIDLAWQPATNLWPVKMDPAQTDQILANLCVNARDAIGKVGKITIETENVVLDEAYCAGHARYMPGQYVMLAVSDDGRGMDKAILDSIFEPFFTTKGLGKGTGLGLSTVYGIVKQNQGFINVYSEPGKGTTFKIYLPRHEGETDTRPEEARDQVSQGRGETILMVEDEPSVLAVGKRILEMLGYAVLAAGSPGEAMDLAQGYAGEIHLLLTDVVMPEMSGKDLAEEITKLRPNMKILFMSGYTANAVVHRGVLDRSVRFIQKPFGPNSLARKVREVLEG